MTACFQICQHPTKQWLSCMETACLRSASQPWRQKPLSRRHRWCCWLFCLFSFVPSIIDISILFRRYQVWILVSGKGEDETLSCQQVRFWPQSLVCGMLDRIVIRRRSEEACVLGSSTMPSRASSISSTWRHTGNTVALPNALSGHSTC